MILFRALGANEDGLTIFETNGTFTANVTVGGTPAFEHHKTAGGWNELGFRMTDPIVGANGHALFFDQYCDVTRDFICGFLNGTSLGVSNNVSAYFTGGSANNIRMIDGGTTPGSLETYSPGTAQWRTLRLKLADGSGTVELANAAQGDYEGSFTTTHTSTTPAAAFNPVGANLRFATNLFTGAPTDQYIANVLYTDGEVNPPPPASLAEGTITQTTVDVTWDDDDINAVNADGVDIFADDGGGEVLVGTADVGDEAGQAAGLTADTEYDIIARAYVTLNGDKFYSDDSNTITVTTAGGSSGGGGGLNRSMNMAALMSLLGV